MRHFKSLAVFGFAFAVLSCLSVLGIGHLGADVALQSPFIEGGLEFGATGVLAGLAGLVVNKGQLTNLFVSFKTMFLSALGKAEPHWQKVAMLVPSTTKSNTYGWLGKFPNVREWIGDRVVHSMVAHTYTIDNKDYELTIGVDRNDIEDDNLGIYSPMFSEMGDAIMAKPDQLVYDLLKAGFTTPCYDGQNFFDTDHPVLDEDGNPISMANTDGGSGNAWFLLDDSRIVKPIIFQQRKKPDFTAMDQDTDEKVFSSREFRYGTHSRCNVGFGFWQLIWGSKQTLDAAHFKTAFETLGGNKGDYGRPLNIRGRKLVVGMSNFEAAKKIVGAKELAGGGDNPWYGMAEVVLVPWLD